MSERARAPGPVALVACHDCGLLHRVRGLPAGCKAVCSRCDGLLWRVSHNGMERALACTFAALILLAVALGSPFMTFELEGRAQEMTLGSSAAGLYRSGMWGLALAVLLTTIVMPLTKLLAALYVLLPLRLGRRAPGAGRVFRAVRAIAPWAMTEVYLLGAIVAYVKLSDLAQLQLDAGLFAFVAAILAMAAADAALEPHEVWQRLAPQADAPPPDRPLDDGALAGCHACGQICRVRPGERKLACPRCAAPLHRRKPKSAARTWALVVAATILYVPANLLPVMAVIYFGTGEADTILSGVKTLIAANMWPVALLVFFASITVPVLKLCGLVYLLVSIRRRSDWRPRDRTRLYRIIEGIGRWSMVDIFMISILVALVNLGALATVEPRDGAIAFAAVVVMTMLASMTFDPRLIWDIVEKDGAGRPRAGG